jgi:hypothetical protein
VKLYQSFESTSVLLHLGSHIAFQRVHNCQKNVARLGFASSCEIRQRGIRMWGARVGRFNGLSDTVGEVLPSEEFFQ